MIDVPHTTKDANLGLAGTLLKRKNFHRKKTIDDIISKLGSFLSNDLER